MKRLFPILLVLLLLPIVPGFSQPPVSSDIEGLKSENAALRARVEALEKALDEVKECLGKKPAEPVSAPAAALTAPCVPPAVPPAAVPAPEKAAKPEKPSLKGKYNVDLYGYMKLDLAWDDSRTDTGNFARWALSNAAANSADRQFSETINQTRFGLDFSGPQAGKAKVTGKYEVDLYGGGAENSAMLRTRHAYFQVEWPEIALLMGQTWDLVGPENPNTLNYTVAWQTGNIGFRHPQLRLSKTVKSGDCKLVLAAAASRKVGDASTFSSTPDTGADSGSPAFQGRVGYTFPTGKSTKGTIGIWGHQGNDEYDYDNKGNSRSIRSSSLGADVNIAFTKTFQLKGEIWQGQNLDEYQGGINQGIVVTSASGTYINNAVFGGAFIDAKALKSKGGWFELTFGPFTKWRYNIGASQDNPDDDLLANSMRTLNRSRWINALYDLNDAVQIGAEYLNLVTEYKGQQRGDDGRYQLSFLYKF